MFVICPSQSSDAFGIGPVRPDFGDGMTTMFDTPFDNNEDRPRDEIASERLPEDNAAAGQESGSGEQGQGSRRWPFLLLIALVIGLSWWVLSGKDAPAAAPPVPVVTVATPLQSEVTEWDEFIGRFEASRSVEIRPRVSGQITAVHFTDGQFVRSGAPLFTIDPRPYRASLAEAQARVASSETALDLSRSNLDRAQRLVTEDAIAANEIDRLSAEVRANEAAVAAARALVRSRILDVEFTTVRAPISGRVSDRRIDVGNMVAAGDGSAASLLTTINAVDLLHFTFNGSEGLYLKAKREGLDRGAEVQIRLQDEAEYSHSGTLDFTDNALDPQSGTIRARALVRNPDGFLTPGMFGNMRLATGGTKQALLVPETAIVTDQTRKMLLVVNEEGVVGSKLVELGPIVDGLRVIHSGIEASDRVVIDGTQMAFPGSTVQAEQGVIERSNAPASPAVQSELPSSDATIVN